jgi:hypothetical protein
MRSVRQFLFRRRLYRDLSAEIQQHLEERVEELVANGMPRPVADYAARREFGNLARIEETSREVWTCFLASSKPRRLHRPNGSAARGLGEPANRSRSAQKETL